MMKRVFKMMSKVLDVPKQNLFAFATFHPTSTDEPWKLHPHVEFMWAHANVDSDRIIPLETHESGILKPIELDYMKDIWEDHYPGTKNLKVLYEKELHFGMIRYLVRPMAEDVWHSVRKGFLDVDEVGTIPPEAEVGLRREGGVIFWRYYTRVRYFGAAANRKFNAICRGLNKPRIEQPNAVGDCPCCGVGKMEVERDSEGVVTVSLSPYHEPEVDNIMFTTWKSNSRKGDEAAVEE